MISVLQLGTIDYATGLRLQEKLVGLRKDGRIGDVVLLLEHTPVITLGRNAKSANLVATPEMLVQRGVEVFECDRGGDVTFHGPGQLVAYPIFDLRGFPAESGSRKTLGAVEYVRKLEEVLIRTCAEFGIPGRRIAGLTGVWTEGVSQLLGGPGGPPLHDSLGGRGHPSPQRPSPRGDSLRPSPDDFSSFKEQEKKIAAIGVHISRGVTSHGLALNVNNDLSFFNLIVPCGISSKPVTSMRNELGREVRMQDVAHALSRDFGTVFQSQMLWLDSLDALLGNNLGIPMRVPEELRKIDKDDTTWA